MDFDSLSLLTKPVSPKVEIQAGYIEAQVTEDVFPNGAFAIAVPKGWRIDREQPGIAPEPENPVVELARFSPGIPEALGEQAGVSIRIWCILLTREIHAADWLTTWISSQNYTLIAARELPSKSGLLGDALALRQGEDGSTLHRLYTVKDGDLIYLVDGRATVTKNLNAEAMQEIVLMAMMRFRLLEPTGQFFAEPFTAAILQAGQSRLTFAAPQSWQSRAGDDAPDGGASLTLSNTFGDATVGTLLAVLGGEEDTAEELEEKSLAKLRNQGFTIGDAAPSLEAPAQGDSPRQLLRYDGRVDGSDIAILCARHRVDGLAISMMLITPTSDVSFEAWAINRRAFDIASSSLALG